MSCALFETIAQAYCIYTSLQYLRGVTYECSKMMFWLPYHNLPLCFFGENFDSDNGGGIDSQTF
jgi:hypothetical protein